MLNILGIKEFQTLLDPCVTPVREAPGDSAEPGDRFQDLEISRFQDFKISSFQVLEEESVRFRGHQAEVAMITITACSYLTLGDPPQQPECPHTTANTHQPAKASPSRLLQVTPPQQPG